MGTRIVFGALAALLLAPPAHAAELDPVCHEVLDSSPTVTADLDGDGTSDVPAVRVHDVVVCSDAEARYATHPGLVSVENCAWPTGPIPSCLIVRITLVPVEASVGASGSVCYTVEGAAACETVTTPPTPGLPHETICLGWSLEGYSPCRARSSDDR